MSFPSSATGSIVGNRATGSRDMIPKGYRLGQLQQFTPEQTQLFQSLFSHLQPGSFLSNLSGGSPEAFEQLEAPALRQFGELQGGLASRFSGIGSGARRSSAHNLAQGQLASDFAQQLQSQRLGLQRQAIQDLLGLSHDLLGVNPYQKFLIEEKQKPGFLSKLLGIGLPVGGAALGGAFGGLGGASLGSRLGSTFGSKFF